MNGLKTEYISIREACVLTGLCSQTLRKLGDQNKIICYRTTSGQRKFDKHSLEKMCDAIPSCNKVSNGEKQNFIYTRVSSKKQSDDLCRQVDFVKSRKPEYASYTSISDIASGINFKRKGLEVILDSCLQNNIGNVVIAHKDRLSRFGFDLIEQIVNKAGGKIIVIDDEKNKSTEQELSEDLLSIVHIYCCRQMGKRSYKTRKYVESNQNKVEIKPLSETDH